MITTEDINQAFAHASKAMMEDIRKEVVKVMMMDDVELKAYMALKERQNQIERCRRTISDLEDRLGWERKSLEYLTKS